MTRPAVQGHKATPDTSPATQGKPFEFAPLHSPLVQSESPVSSSPPHSIVATRTDSVHAQDLSDKLGELALAPKRPNGPATYSDEESDSDDSSSDSDDDDEGKEDDDEDSDLDEEELAQEEALAEQARKTAQSAGELASECRRCLLRKL